jgi:hypothetical protein
MKKPRPFNIGKEIRAIARERIGYVPCAKVIGARSFRKRKEQLKWQDQME